MTNAERDHGVGDDADGGEAADALFVLLRDELRAIAAARMRGQSPDHSLQVTALVNEAWLRLGTGSRQAWRSQDHFLAVAATAMRQILVDHARRKQSDKRTPRHDAGQMATIVADFQHRADDLIDLDAALTELATFDPKLAQIVELRFFAGLSHEEVARITGSSLRSVERHWKIAKGFLHRQMHPEEEAGADAS